MDHSIIRFVIHLVSLSSNSLFALSVSFFLVVFEYKFFRAVVIGSVSCSTFFDWFCRSHKEADRIPWKI